MGYDLHIETGNYQVHGWPREFCSRLRLHRLVLVQCADFGMVPECRLLYTEQTFRDALAFTIQV